MVYISDILTKAVEDAGVYTTEGEEGLPPDIYKPALELLRDLVAELNTQNAIQFEQSNVDVFVTGNKLTFKPYTEDEQAIIDGGGTVDITDRLVDFIPVTNPIVFKDNYHLDFVSYRDLLDRRTASTVTSYAFNISFDKSELIFNTPVGATLNILRSVPITMDDEPYGQIYIPEPYVHYLVTRLSESVALRWQFHDTASIYAQKSDRTGKILANNVASRKVVVKRNLCAGLDRYRKYSL